MGTKTGNVVRRITKAVRIMASCVTLVLLTCYTSQHSALRLDLESGVLFGATLTFSWVVLLEMGTGDLLERLRNEWRWLLAMPSLGALVGLTLFDRSGPDHIDLLKADMGMGLVTLTHFCGQMMRHNNFQKLFR